jgi:hypothetical protein
VFTRRSSGAGPYSNCGNIHCQAKSTALYDYDFKAVSMFSNRLDEKPGKVPISCPSLYIGHLLDIDDEAAP